MPPPKNLWVSLRLNHRFALFSQCFRGSVGLSFRGSDFHRACGTKNRMKKTTSRGVDEPLPPSLSHRPSPRVSRGRCDGEGGRGGPLLSSPSGGLPDQTCVAITSISPTDSPEEPFFLTPVEWLPARPSPNASGTPTGLPITAVSNSNELPADRCMPVRSIAAQCLREF